MYDTYPRRAVAYWQFAVAKTYEERRHLLAYPTKHEQCEWNTEDGVDNTHRLTHHGEG